ncbi:hypothetical protein HK11_12355 [Acetobacter sp. DmW_043]|nr:hypothetical protein HK11_12355 [Acetobacter sp. DmW_043]
MATQRGASSSWQGGVTSPIDPLKGIFLSYDRIQNRSTNRTMKYGIKTDGVNNDRKSYFFNLIEFFFYETSTSNDIGLQPIRRVV